MNLNTEILCSIIKGRFLHKKNQTSFRGVSIDSREADLNQKIFFAIKGVHFDGHDFLDQALKKGVSVLVVHKTVSCNTNSTTIIEVNDTLKALHLLTSWWRKKLNFSVIGITGSTGKTTTKNFCLTLLASTKFPSSSHSKSNPPPPPPLHPEEKTLIASPKSFNNMYGVPLTFLSATENTKIVIQEIGMNQKGEIKNLCQLAQPDIVVVTQIGSSHIGILGNKASIAKEKEEIYINSPKATGVFNLDDPYTRDMYDRWTRHDKTRKTICFLHKTQKQMFFFNLSKSINIVCPLQVIYRVCLVPSPYR